ncbi:MAG: thiopurine S-methyltransferase, partial [Gammaproteobacteria bacterium]
MPGEGPQGEEEAARPGFWEARWAQGRTGFHQPRPNPLLERHWAALGVPPEAPVLVPLCGKSLDMVWLRQQGHPVVGVEVVEQAVAAFFAERGLRPRRRPAGAAVLWEAGGYRILQGDLFALGPEEVGPVGACYDRAALVALPRSARRRYVAHLGRLLPAAAPCLLITLDYPPGEMEGPPFSVPPEEVWELWGRGGGQGGSRGQASA